MNQYVSVTIKKIKHLNYKQAQKVVKATIDYLNILDSFWP